MKRLQSEKGWLTKGDFNTIARDQNSRNLDAYVFSPDMYSEICCILFPVGGPFRQKRWDNFYLCLEKIGFDEQVMEKERIFFPLGINCDTGAHKDPNHRGKHSRERESANTSGLSEEDEDARKEDQLEQRKEGGKTMRKRRTGGGEEGQGQEGSLGKYRIRENPREGQ